jgi:hypothetical protein
MARPIFVLLVLALSACDCGGDDSLVHHCPLDLECYLTTSGDVVVEPNVTLWGQCSMGHVASCTEAGEPVCEGYVLPAEEVCDGLDNDCNRLVDELPPRQSDDIANTCAWEGACTYPQQTCMGGTWTCSYPFGPSDEVCNGRDDDCDGELDEGLEIDEFYYPSDEYPETVGVGECRPGIMSCRDGAPHTVPAVIPRPEICNDLDDDCDGLVDEDEEDDAQRAVALVIDKSGSMASIHSALVGALCDWSQNSLSFTATRFAAVYVAYGSGAPFVTTVQDFTTADVICQRLQDFNPSSITSSEFMLEGVALADSMAWPEGFDRYIFAFTDEPMQLYSGGSTVESTSVRCHEAPFVLGLFADHSTWLWAENDCGFREPLHESQSDMADALQERLSSSDCGVLPQ